MMPEITTTMRTSQAPGVTRSVTVGTADKPSRYRTTDDVQIVGLLDQVAVEGLPLAELVGLLVFTSGVNLYVDELADDHMVVNGLQYALLATRTDDRQALGKMAARVLARKQAPEHEYAALVARAVTRVCGVTA